MQDSDLSEEFQSMRKQDREWNALKLIAVGASALGAALLVIYLMSNAAQNVQDHHGPTVERSVSSVVSSAPA